MSRLCFNCMKISESTHICPYCNSSDISARAPYHIKPGSKINSRYIVGRSLGEGGFGITYIGFDERLNRRVAIKEYYPSGTANRHSGDNTIIVTQGKSEQFDRGKINFIQEARAVAEFTNVEGIVDVYDSFEENQTAYIIMEYLDGVTLKQYLSQNGVIREDILIELMMPVMKSLNTMHSRGIIHRDISPDNIMYTTSGKLILMDFGSARYFANEEKELSVILKHGYAPEEQYRSKGRQGPYTDVYALCATIYACITGRPPEDSVQRIVNDTLVPPSRRGVIISEAHERALMHGLAVYAQYRCPDMQTLINEFSGNYNNYNPYDRTRGAEDPYYMPTKPQPNYYSEPPKRQSNAPVIVAIAISLAAIAALVTVLIILISGNGRDNEGTTETTAATETATVDVNNNVEADTTVPEPTVISNGTYTAPPATEQEPETEPTVPETEKVTAEYSPSHSYSPGDVSNLSHSEVDSICSRQIAPIYTATMEADTNGYLDSSRYEIHGNYSIFRSASDTYRIVYPYNRYDDGKSDRTWYYFDKDGTLVFVFSYENSHQYRYYVYNDRVIKLDYRDGPDDKSNKAVKYYHDSSGLRGDSDEIIANAYEIRDYVLGN